MHRQFQSHALEGLGRRGHDLLARWDGPREGDLLDMRVVDEPGPESLVPAEHLDDARGEDLLGDFGEFETRVWSERSCERTSGKMQLASVVFDHRGPTMASR